jgi:DNA-directed RNA polymerase specialized sigma24 family protein
LTKASVSKKTDPRVQTLRSLFRNLHAFRALYETDGIQELTGPDGVVWSLWDLEELYRAAVNTDMLPSRQRQAIEMFLVLNMSEADVATKMQIRASNPIGMYASSGLVHLLAEMDAGHVINPWIDNDAKLVDA